MHTVSLTFQLEWKLEDLSPKEHNPEIRVFFDNRIVREPIVIKHSDRPESYTINGRVSTHVKELPSNLHVSFSGFAWRKNDMGAPCLLDIGTNHLQFSEIAEQVKLCGQFQIDLPLIMRTTTEVDPKELITVMVRKGDVQIPYELEFAKPPVSSSIEQVGASMNQYIESALTYEQQMQDTIPGTSRIRMPSYIGESGLELTNGNPLPAVAFTLSETPKTNTAFWLNTFNQAMKRDNLVPSDWDRLNVEGQTRITLNMITQLPQAFDYVSDTVDKNKKNDPNGYNKAKVVGIEQFSDSLVTGSGDCEDGGAAIKDCHTAFLKLRIDEKNSKLRYLRESQALAAQYIPCMSLDAVNGAAVADQVQHIGAHLNSNFVPIHQFQKWLSHNREGRKLCNSLFAGLKIPVRTDVPFSIGEGTGPYDAIGYRDPFENAVGYVHQIRDLQGFRTVIKHDHGKTTNFFIGSLTGMTDFFIRRGYNVGSFLYCTKQPNGTLTRGAYYDDMINHPEKITLIMHEKVPDQVMEVIKDGVSIRVPPEPLILTNKTFKDDHTAHNEHLEYIKQKVRDMNRRKAVGNNKMAKVNIYIRDYQINQKIAERVVEDIRKLPSIVSVDYYRELYTDKFYGYNMQIECMFTTEK